MQRWLYFIAEALNDSVIFESITISMRFLHLLKFYHRGHEIHELGGSLFLALESAGHCFKRKLGTYTKPREWRSDNFH